MYEFWFLGSAFASREEEEEAFLAIVEGRRCSTVDWARGDLSSCLKWVWLLLPLWGITSLDVLSGGTKAPSRPDQTRELTFRWLGRGPEGSGEETEAGVDCCWSLSLASVSRSRASSSSSSDFRVLSDCCLCRSPR